MCSEPGLCIGVQVGFSSGVPSESACVEECESNMDCNWYSYDRERQDQQHVFGKSNFQNVPILFADLFVSLQLIVLALKPVLRMNVSMDKRTAAFLKVW